MKLAVAERLSRARFQAGFRVESGHSLERLGSDACGWTVPREIDETWCCYTVGIGEDATFDVALADRGCDVVAIDPTPRALQHIEPIAAQYSNLTVLPYALWVEDAPIEFFAPRVPGWVSYSAVDRHDEADALMVPGRRLATIAAELGHDRVDLLKLDIEGAEYAVLDDCDLEGLGVRVMCIEFHDTTGARDMVSSVRRLQARGFSPVSRRQTDVTFVRERN